MMFLFFVIIRGFLVLRVLLEANRETWTERGFNSVQQALRNGILLADEGDLEQEEAVKQMIIKNPGKRCFEYRQLLAQQGEPVASRSTSVWEATFLRAKVSSYVEQALHALDVADASEGNVRKIQTRRKKAKRGTKVLKEINSKIDQSGAVSTGVLVSIRGPV